MKAIKMLYLGGVPDDNVARVVRWNPSGFDLYFAGNCVVNPLFADKRISAVKVYLGGEQPNNEVRLPGQPDVIFSGLCSHESSRKSIAYAENFCNQAQAHGIGVINHPAQLVNTTRNRTAEDYRQSDVVVVPEIRLLPAPSIRDIRQMLDQGEIQYPAVLRTSDSHNGQFMVRLMGPQDMDELGVLPFDGRDYYAIQYMDYANSEGVYRKFRLIKVGEGIYGRHMISSRQWKIHAGQRNESPNDDPISVKDENQFLDDPRGFLGDEICDALVAGLTKTGLDYVAMDFSLLPDGRAVVFERNACFNNFAKKARNAAMEKAQNQVTTALVKLVLDKAAAGSGVHST